MGHFVEGSNKGYSAGADLTAYTAVKLNADRNVVPAAAATDAIIGVVNAAVKSGWETDVRLRSAAGTLNIVAAATIGIGQPVTSDAAGKAIVATVAGQQIIGYALEPVVSGQVLEVLPSTGKF
jgi:hypothetical protein